jgi:hypothetical protein
MSQSSLKTNEFGLRLLSNPYLQPKTVFGKTPQEFIVLKLDIEAPEPERIKWSTEILDASGNEVAAYKDRDKLDFFWEDYPGLDDDAANRASVLSHTYIPSQSFMSKKGHTTYYIVCYGKYPLPRPYTVTASVFMGDQLVDTLSVEVTEPPEGQKKAK